MCRHRKSFNFVATKTKALDKILVIRFSSIGDIVLTTPVLRCLKEQLDGVSVHVVTKRSNRALYSANPYVDEVFDFEYSEKEVIPMLKSMHYDHIVDLQKNIRSARICRALRCRVSSYPKLNFRKMLLTCFKINRMPDIHVVDRYFKAVECLGVHNDGRGLDFFFAEGDEMFDADIPEEFHDGYVAVAIGGQHNTKVLPDRHIIRVCELLDYPIILIGGANDFIRGQRIADAVGQNIWNSCGGLTVGQSASVIRMADAVLTNDTGMMHIAAAFRKPIVSVWGNTVPDFGMYPYLPSDRQRSVIVQNDDISCRPCHKLGYKKCPRGHFRCMTELDPAVIAHALRQMVERYGDDEGLRKSRY